MDNITHVLLGGAMAYGMVGKRVGRLAFLIGGLAATLPDFDVFIRTGDALLNKLIHRHFTHALVLVPVFAALAVLPFLKAVRVRENWWHVYFAAVAACLTHTVIDTLTPYGTMILWPFTTRRFAVDVVVMLDIFYTLILLVGVVLALRWKSTRAAIVTLVVSTLWLGGGALQHERAKSAQRELLASRGHMEKAVHWRVLPQVGAAVNYRSVYIYDNHIYADAIRVLPFKETRVRLGAHVEVVWPMWADGGFWEFADGFVAWMPGEGMLGDMRYTLTPEGFDAIWGISRDGSEWRNFMRGRGRMAGRMWGELVRPEGYVGMSELDPGMPPNLTEESGYYEINSHIFRKWKYIAITAPAGKAMDELVAYIKSLPPVADVAFHEDMPRSEFQASIRVTLKNGEKENMGFCHPRCGR